MLNNDVCTYCVENKSNGSFGWTVVGVELYGVNCKLLFVRYFLLSMSFHLRAQQLTALFNLADIGSKVAKQSLVYPGLANQIAELYCQERIRAGPQSTDS